MESSHASAEIGKLREMTSPQTIRYSPGSSISEKSSSENAPFSFSIETVSFFSATRPVSVSTKENEEAVPSPCKTAVLLLPGKYPEPEKAMRPFPGTTLHKRRDPQKQAFPHGCP